MSTDAKHVLDLTVFGPWGGLKRSSDPGALVPHSSPLVGTAPAIRRKHENKGKRSQRKTLPWRVTGAMSGKKPQVCCRDVRCLCMEHTGQAPACSKGCRQRILGKRLELRWGQHAGLEPSQWLPTVTLRQCMVTRVDSESPTTPADMQLGSIALSLHCSFIGFVAAGGSPE